MKAILAFCILSFAAIIFPFRASAIGCMYQGSDTISTVTTITGGCIINGDLVILNNGALQVDLTGGQPDTFVVRGNILLQGNATLFIHADSGSTGGIFIVSNSVNNQRTITTQGASRVLLEYVEFRTQEGDLSNASSFYMNFNAEDSSLLFVTGCWLNPQTAWLLCNLTNKSNFTGRGSNEVPTEIYVQDSARMSVHGTDTKIGVWLLFATTTDTLNLPDQTGAYFNWQAGRGTGGVNASGWVVTVDSAKPGLGVQVQPFAKVVVNGTGVPATGEIHANILFTGGTDTVANLGAGLQNITVAKGRLTLNNVNLGPVGWQLYSVSNENLYVVNCLVNELGVVGPHNAVVVDSSTLQLATLSALGSNGSTVEVNNSSIWSQAIIAANTCALNIYNCNVTGSWFSTDGISYITATGGCFMPNPTGCTQNNMVNISTGMPNCNPFIPAGGPLNHSPSTVTFNGVYACSEAVENLIPDQEIIVYPNPSSGVFIIQQKTTETKTVRLLNIVGMPLKEFSITGTTTQFDINNLPSGVYLLQIDNSKGSAKVISLFKE